MALLALWGDDHVAEDDLSKNMALDSMLDSGTQRVVCILPKLPCKMKSAQVEKCYRWKCPHCSYVNVIARLEWVCMCVRCFNRVHLT